MARCRKRKNENSNLIKTVFSNKGSSKELKLPVQLPLEILLCQKRGHPYGHQFYRNVRKFQIFRVLCKSPEPPVISSYLATNEQKVLSISRRSLQQWLSSFLWKVFQFFFGHWMHFLSFLIQSLYVRSYSDHL